MKEFTVVLSIDNENPVYQVQAESAQEAFVLAAKENYHYDFGSLEDFNLDPYGCMAVFAGHCENLYSSTW